MTSFEPPRLQRSILTDEVHEMIKTLIMDGAISPGDRVGIDALSRQLGVSQTPIREALARLEAERLVYKEPRKGYRTTELLTRQNLVDLFAFRSQIEPPAAKAAAEHASDDQIEAIVTELSGHATAPGGGAYREYRNFTAHDAHFHQSLFEAAGNPYAAQAHEGLHVHLHLFRLHYQDELGEQTLREHSDIADAVIARDGDRAAAAMESHLHDSLQRLLTSAADRLVDDSLTERTDTQS